MLLFEVFNAGPGANNEGGGEGRPSAERLWDGLLSLGRRMIGVAVDDAHEFRAWGYGRSNPGRAWVHVLADSAADSDVIEALVAGDCYASTGPELEALSQTSEQTAVDVAQVSDRHYRTSFIGSEGRLLDCVEGLQPRHRHLGTEGYVRARVDDSDGRSACLQPHLVD